MWSKFKKILKLKKKLNFDRDLKNSHRLWFYSRPIQYQCYNTSDCMKLNTWMYLNNPPSRFLCTYLLTKIFQYKDRFKKPNGRQYPTFFKILKKKFQLFFHHIWQTYDTTFIWNTTVLYTNLCIQIRTGAPWRPKLQYNQVSDLRLFPS